MAASVKAETRTAYPLAGAFEAVIDRIAEATVKHREARLALLGHLGYSATYPGDGPTDGNTASDHRRQLAIARERLDAALMLFASYLDAHARSETAELFSQAPYESPRDCVCVRDTRDRWDEIAVIFGAWGACSALIVGLGDAPAVDDLLNRARDGHIETCALEVLTKGAILISLVKSFCKRAGLDA